MVSSISRVHGSALQVQCKFYLICSNGRALLNVAAKNRVVSVGSSPSLLMVVFLTSSWTWDVLAGLRGLPYEYSVGSIRKFQLIELIFLKKSKLTEIFFKKNK